MAMLNLTPFYLPAAEVERISAAFAAGAKTVATQGDLLTTRDTFAHYTFNVKRLADSTESFVTAERVPLILDRGASSEAPARYTDRDGWVRA